MRKYVYIIILLLPAMSYGQKHDPGEYNAKVVFESSPHEGEITVTSTGIGKKQFKSAKDAESAVFYTIFFRGVPGSQYELPMVPNEMEKKDDPVIVELLKGKYRSFLIASTLVSEKSQKKRYKKKGNVATYRITVNCMALRKYLEQNGVIRKFGI